MPWKLEKADGGYYVTNIQTGKRMSKKPLPKVRASAQLSALYANVPEAREEKDVSAIPSAVMVHGPGGLFSTPGIGGAKEEPKKKRKWGKKKTIKSKGNFGHKSVPGHRGGSAPRGGAGATGTVVAQPSGGANQDFLMKTYGGDPEIFKKNPKQYLKLLKDVHDANEYLDLYDMGDEITGDGADFAKSASREAYKGLTTALDSLKRFEDSVSGRQPTRSEPTQAVAQPVAKKPNILQRIFQKRPAKVVTPTQIFPRYYQKMHRRKEFVWGETTKGGSGSGGFGHTGVKGRWGGSMPGSGGNVAKIPQIKYVGAPKKKRKWGKSKTTPKINDSGKDVMNVKETIKEKLSQGKCSGNFRQWGKINSYLYGESSSTVFKEASGKFRWVLFSSNAFEDRDREIVSTKALADDVERADLTKDFGPLRWWHVQSPPLDIGDCDFNMLYGKILIESGTFRDERVGARMKDNASRLQVSIGFNHPVSEPDHEGVFHHIRRFERSLLPAGIASNLLTTVVVKGVDNMATAEEKKKAFAEIVGDGELADSILKAAEDTEKKAVEKGLKTKEVAEKGAKGKILHRKVEETYDQSPEEEALETPEEEVAEAPVEAVAKPVVRPVVKKVSNVGDQGATLEEDTLEEAGAPQAAADQATADQAAQDQADQGAQDQMPEVIGNMSIDEFAGLLADALAAALEPYLAQLKEVSDTVSEVQGQVASRAKEASRGSEEVEALKSKTEKTEKALQMAARALKAATDRIADLESDVPSGARGYVASQAEDTVVTDEKRIKEQQPTPDPIADFINNMVLTPQQP